MLSETQANDAPDTTIPVRDMDVRDVPIVVHGDQEDAWYDRVSNDNLPFGSLDEAISHILHEHEQDGERSDRKVEDLDRWLFGVAGGFACIARGNDVLYLRMTAFGHLCERAKAPSKYLRSIPARYTVPALNWGMLNKSEGPALIRLAGEDEVRAILSQRYATFDDSVVLPQLRTGLDAAGMHDLSARVVATGLTTLMRLTIPGESFDLPGDEVAELAIDYTNGEVGNRAVQLAPAVYLRRAGLSARRVAGLRMRHLGSSDKLVEGFREALPEALAGARTLRAQIIKAVDLAISDIVAEADKLRSYGLSIADAREVLRNLADRASVALPHDTAEWEGPLSTIENTKAYDVFLAIARVGETKGIDRRLDLEEAAAKYLAKVAK